MLTNKNFESIVDVKFIYSVLPFFCFGTMSVFHFNLLNLYYKRFNFKRFRSFPYTVHLVVLVYCALNKI